MPIAMRSGDFRTIQPFAKDLAQGNGHSRGTYPRGRRLAKFPAFRSQARARKRFTHPDSCNTMLSLHTPEPRPMPGSYAPAPTAEGAVPDDRPIGEGSR